MKTQIAYRKTSRLLTSFSILISLTFMIVWLPLVRSVFDGVSYQWGTNFYGFQIQGAGITPSFSFLVIQLAFYAALIWSMYWVKNRYLFEGLLVLWFFNVFGNLLSDIIINGDTMFHGDTLNVHISITWIIVPLSILAIIFIIFIILADRKADNQSIHWNARNTRLMWLILGPIPILGLLLASGEPHGITDQIGVIIAIAQCFLIPLIFRPYGSKSLQPE
ncbi:MAG: ubiquinol cytochrome C oxidoreductase [Cyclobacteriaceae bacterium]